MTSAICISNCSNPGLSVTDPPIVDIMAYFEYQPWLFSLLGSVMVGLSGVFPILVVRIDESSDLKHGASADLLKVLLSFAVGGLLGDVFLHLLPEAWAHNISIKEHNSHPPLNCGLWVLAGFLVFIIAEKMFNNEETSDEADETAEVQRVKNTKYENNNVFVEKHLENNNCIKEHMPYTNGYIIEQINDLVYSPQNGDLKYDALHKINGHKNKNGYTNGYHSNGFVNNELPYKNGVVQNGIAKKALEHEEVKEKEKPKHISGYLNLLANCIDNFTHGLAVGGSFLISFRLGALTTFAILIHEIPHEIGDFAILLRSGFNKWDAAKAQLLTATGGIVGALVAVLCSGDGIESKTGWILPFTAGGFLHIGLVSILPELVKETNAKESFKQLAAMLIGISLMAILTIICD